MLMLLLLLLLLLLLCCLRLQRAPQDIILAAILHWIRVGRQCVFRAEGFEVLKLTCRERRNSPVANVLCPSIFGTWWLTYCGALQTADRRKRMTLRHAWIPTQ